MVNRELGIFDVRGCSVDREEGWEVLDENEVLQDGEVIFYFQEK